MTSIVRGTRGYEKVTVAFVELSRSVEFTVVNRDFLPFLPTASSRILDLGSGAGQNSAAMAAMGHTVGVAPLLGESAQHFERQRRRDVDSGGVSEVSLILPIALTQEP